MSGKILLSMKYMQDTCKYMHIHAHTCTYMPIHTHTYTYIPPTISVTKGFWGAAAAARDSYAQRHLPRSAPTGLRMGSSRSLCAWRAHGRCRGAASPLPDACSAHGRPKTGLGTGL